MFVIFILVKFRQEDPFSTMENNFFMIPFYDRPLSGSVVGSFSCPGLEDMSGFVPPLFRYLGSP